jgi:hypothetical protein
MKLRKPYLITLAQLTLPSPDPGEDLSPSSLDFCPPAQAGNWKQRIPQQTARRGFSSLPRRAPAGGLAARPALSLSKDCFAEPTRLSMRPTLSLPKGGAK